MTAPETPHKLRKAPIFTPYVLFWATLGALSLGTILVLGLAPEWLDDLRPASIMGDPQSNQGQRAAARLAADIGTLKQSVAQVQLDIAQVKTVVASNTAQQKAVSAQVATLESRLGKPADSTVIEASAAPQPDTATPPAAPEAAPAQTLRGYATAAEKAAGDKIAAAEPPPTLVTSVPVTPAPVATVAPAAAPPHAPKVINADASSLAAALETGSVTTAPKPATDVISFGPAVVKPAPKPVGVKISTGASLDSLRLSWSMLAEKHGDTLKSMEARYVTSGDAQNPTYDLVAGPLKSKSEANKVCKSLAAKGVPCSVGPFGGEAL